VDFDKILIKSLAFKPKDRYQTMEEFKTALQNALNQHPYPTDTHETVPPKRHHKQPEEKATPRPSRPLRVFLSHAKSDADHVAGLAAALHQEKVKVRPDKKNSEPGENWQEKISRDVQRSDAVIVCLTKDSVAKNGTLQPEIKLALEVAHEHSLFIIPARLHECKIPQELSIFKYIDLFEEDGYLKLHSLLATRAKQINANPPLTGAFYFPPQIVEKNPKSMGYVPLVAIFFIALLAILLLYSPLRPYLLGATPTQETAATDTIVATEPRASNIPTRVPEVVALPQKITDRTGTEMVLVASGEFTMGYKAEEALEECKKYSKNCSLHLFLRAEPALISLKSYYIDKREVSNGGYQKCVDAKVCKPPQQTRSFTRPEYYGTKEFESYPVVYISWYMAKTYCEEWRGARLPTEAEWEKAARGSDGDLFPWGKNIGGPKVNFCDRGCPVGSANKNFVDGYSDTAPVTALANGASKYGVLNMAGNVWEWVSSLYKQYPYDANDGREILEEGGIDGEIIRVVRGGSWRDDINRLFSITRNGYDPSVSNDSIGFRCARTP
jgi:formylglycine-generating enzyme required for sulfatase activity